MNGLIDLFKMVTVNPLFRFIGRKIEKKHFPDPPIFIVASPRSGTTLLLSILGAHPNIFAIPLQTYAFDRWKKIKNKTYSQYPYRIDRLYRYLIFHSIKKTAGRWCEKTPRHINSLTKIIDFYQERLKIIHIVRDGRDVAVSSHPTHKGRHYWVPIKKWLKDVKKGLEYKDKPYVLTVFYEDLVQDFENEAKKIFIFLEEPFTEKVKNWVKETNIKQSIHWQEKVQNVHTRAIGKWKTPQHKAKMKEFFNNQEAMKLLKKLGYEI